MSNLTAQVKITAPKEKTWEILADWGAVSNWAPTITESHTTTEAKRGVGSIRSCDHTQMGNIEEEIVAWEEGTSLSYDVIKGLPMPMKSLNNTWSVSGEGADSMVTLKMDFRTRFGPLGALMEMMMLKRMMRKEMGLSLAGLKQYAETGEVVGAEADVSERSLASVT